MNMLAIIKILIDNDDGSVEMKNNILENKINIYQCPENSNVNDLINYFGEYNINNKKTTNEEVKCVKTITAHT